MNTTATNAPSSPVLRIPSRAEGSASGFDTAGAASLPPLNPELEALLEREANLRAYEERLRAWQAQLDMRASGTGSGGPFPRSPSRTPFSGAGDSDLQSAWGKLHRAHALLEAEQNQLRDDRMALRETEKQIKLREVELAARVAQLSEREQQLAAAKAVTPSAAKETKAASRFSASPFRAARAVFKMGS